MIYMKNVSVLLLVLFPFAVMSQSDSLLMEAHHIKFKNAQNYTLSIASMLQEEKFDFKPMDAEMSFKEQLVHVGENICWLTSTYIAEEVNPLSGKKPNAKTMSKGDVLDFLKFAYGYATAAMQHLDESTMNKKFKWSQGQMNKYQFLNLIQDHQAHHVGQLIVYLRLNGITPPKYIGW